MVASVSKQIVHIYFRLGHWIVWLAPWTRCFRTVIRVDSTNLKLRLNPISFLTVCFTSVITAKHRAFIRRSRKVGGLRFWIECQLTDGLFFVIRIFPSSSIRRPAAWKLPLQQAAQDKRKWRVLVPGRAGQQLHRRGCPRGRARRVLGGIQGMNARGQSRGWMNK